MKKFKINPNQIYTITCDNGANMLRAVHLFENDVIQETRESSDVEMDDASEELADTTLDFNSDDSR